LTRFLDVLDSAESRASEPPLDPLVLSFQLKLLWLSGYLPHLTSCAECGAEGPLVGYSPRAGGAVCKNCAGDSLPLSDEGIRGIEGLLATPLAEAEISKRGAREALSVITSSYEYHGGFRLRTLAAQR
jgi:DNA repair protein RecO (recombination protein O)